MQYVAISLVIFTKTGYYYTQDQMYGLVKVVHFDDGDVHVRTWTGFLVLWCTFCLVQSTTTGLRTCGQIYSIYRHRLQSCVLTT
jgi:hypothetical protein